MIKRRLKACPHWRLADFGDSRTFLRQCGQGFTRRLRLCVTRWWKKCFLPF